MIDFKEFLNTNILKTKEGSLKLVPMNEKCSSLLIQFYQTHSHNIFEELINIGDIIDVKVLLKNKKKMADIENLSLLFLKLKIQKAFNDKKLEIITLRQLRWRKVIRKQESIVQFLKNIAGKQNQKEQSVKGICLYIKGEDQMIIELPLKLKNIDLHQPQCKKQKYIKSQFFSCNEEIKKLIQ